MAMTKRTAAAPHKRLNATTRARFLDHLAETANVSTSAKVAKISSSAVYGERRRSPEFRKAWASALAEGYARLEADLLAEALQAAHGKTADATLKARAQKHRLGIALLNAHRTSVKGESSSDASRPTASDLPALKAQLILKLTQMRDRAGLPLEQRPAPEGGGADADT
jgi:hypothetical protein